jgi:hypothetical protein
MAQGLSESEAKQQLVRAVVLEAQLRSHRHLAFLPRAGDPPEIALDRKKGLVLQLHAWAKDPVAFISDNAWVADRRNLFGSEAIPSGMSPKGMVPILMFNKHKEVIAEVDRIFESGEERDVFIDKPRQFALTTVLFGWWLLHKWLFRKSFSFVLGSGKGPDEIDAGGKGKRDDTSLFGRLRMFIDAFLWNFSIPNPDGTRTSLLKFNQHLAPRGVARYPAQKKAAEAWRQNFTGLSDSDDSKNYLSRPKWIVNGIEMFPEAEGNWIVGETPSASFARSKSGTGAGIDEFPHCNENIGPDVDRLSWASCAVNTRFRLAIGTWPRGGSVATEMYRRLRQHDPTTVFMHVHWTDLPVYLFGASWKCPGCGTEHAWDHRESPGHGSIQKLCPVCEETTAVTRHVITSPWFETAKAKLSNDPVSIASEILNDPESTMEGRFFSTFNPRDALVRREHLGAVRMVDGFDPGHSSVYPAAFVAVAYLPQYAKPRIVGYWMASATHIEWWVPFFKRWPSSILKNVTTRWGAKAGQPWLKAFDYPAEALAMMDHLSKFPPGDIYGDTSGSKRMMVESPYEVLSEWKIDVNHRYTADRESLVRIAADWAGRMEIDPRIADLKPPATMTGGWMPSIMNVFMGAKSVKVSQSEKIDIDAKDPPYVKNACDAWAYACRAFGSLSDVMVDRVGTSEFVVSEHDPQPVLWGEGA